MVNELEWAFTSAKVQLETKVNMAKLVYEGLSIEEQLRPSLRDRLILWASSPVPEAQSAALISLKIFRAGEFMDFGRNGTKDLIEGINNMKIKAADLEQTFIVAL